MNDDPLEISATAIGTTIDLLRQAGRHECVLLWLGRREDGVQRIVDVYRPLQECQVDYFEIPRRGMASLMEHLRRQGLYVASQVHTHPGEAFHSPTDDKWAIVRHVGALSIVIPHFARAITPASFLEDAAFFQLDSTNRWIEVRSEHLDDHIRITS